MARKLKRYSVAAVMRVAMTVKVSATSKKAAREAALHADIISAGEGHEYPIDRRRTLWEPVVGVKDTLKIVEVAELT